MVSPNFMKIAVVLFKSDSFLSAPNIFASILTFLVTNQKNETKPFWLVSKKLLSFTQPYVLLGKKGSPRYSLECYQWVFKELLTNLKYFILNFASVIPEHFLTVWIS